MCGVGDTFNNPNEWLAAAATATLIVKSLKLKHQNRRRASEYAKRRENRSQHRPQISCNSAMIKTVEFRTLSGPSNSYSNSNQNAPAADLPPPLAASYSDLTQT